MIRAALAPCLFVAVCSMVSTALAETVPLATAHGKVEAVDRDSLAYREDASCKAGRVIELKLTGTSRATLLSPQVRDGKLVMVQKEVELKNVEKGQPIALIYAKTKDGLVLL